jgi:hypothetical protein
LFYPSNIKALLPRSFQFDYDLTKAKDYREYHSQH